MLIKCPSHNHPYTHYNESIQGSHLLCVHCAIEKAHLLALHSSLPLSSPSLSQQMIQEAREFSPKISDRIASLTSTSQFLSDKIQQLDQSRDLALSQIQNTFQTYRQALDAREEELKGRVQELHKSTRFEMEEEAERAQLYVGQLEQYAKGLEEMEAALTLFSPSIPESLLVDVCLLEASLRSSFSHSMEVEVSPTEGVKFRVSEEEEEDTLLSASENGELEVVRALLDRGDDIHQKNKYGWTPLHWASQEGHLPLASLLLDRGANIHEKDIDEDTPLHDASFWGHLPLASLLLDRGANINEKNNYGETPLKVAKDNHKEDVAAMLRQRGGTL